jgi:putative DNA-invertase from lambdoid prophage Rac
MIYGYIWANTGSPMGEAASRKWDERKLQHRAKLRGLPIDSLFAEGGISKWMPFKARPKGSRLLEVVRHGDIVLTASLPHLFVSVRDAVEVLTQLQQSGVALYLLSDDRDVADDLVSKKLLDVLTGIAETERNWRRALTRKVKKEQRSRNRYLGGTVPFGWRCESGGELVKDPREQAAIRRIYKLRDRGESLRSIAKQMAADGLIISHAGVRKVLRPRGS